MAFVVELTKEEGSALYWAAGRYQSAGVLWAFTEEEENGEGWTIDLPELEAWRYLETLEWEGKDKLVPPCVGGTLKDKLVKLLDEIV